MIKVCEGVVVVDRIKFKDTVSLKDVLKGFDDNENTYDLDSPFDEFVSVDKCTKQITQYGYNILVVEWASQGLLETW